jgi:hypothetical protein
VVLAVQDGPAGVQHFCAVAFADPIKEIPIRLGLVRLHVEHEVPPVVRLGVPDVRALRDEGIEYRLGDSRTIAMGASDQYTSYILEHLSPRENAKITNVAATSAIATVQKESRSSGTKSSVTDATANAAT